jgi:hypothetical protein
MTTQTDFLEDIDTNLVDESQGEKWGWSILRPPPIPAVMFGAFYGLIAGMIVVYDIVVLFRMAKVALPKIRQRTPFFGTKDA